MSRDMCQRVFSPSIQESLAEKNLEETLKVSEKLKRFGLHLGTWFLSTSLAVGCGAGIYFLCQFEQQV